MTAQIHKRAFTLEEYHRIGKTGILLPDDRVELINGEVLELAPIGRRHAACVDRLNQLFHERLRGRAIVRVQSPIALGPRSEPQPDVTLLRPRDDFYASHHPEVDDILLVIEVSESSLEYDREVKLPQYASAGVREVWLVDLAIGQVHVFRDPIGGQYRRVEAVRQDTPMAVEALSDLRLTAREILG